MKSQLSLKLDFFSDLMQCSANLSYWELDSELNLILCNNPDAESLYNIFSTGSCFSYLKEYIQIPNPNPVLLSNPLGMSWIATSETNEDNVCRVHMIGPAFTEELSYDTLQRYLWQKKYPKIFVDQLMNQVNKIPIIFTTSWLQFGTMLHRLEFRQNH